VHQVGPTYEVDEDAFIDTLAEFVWTAPVHSLP
jgi:hypothetical protein